MKKNGKILIIEDDIAERDRLEHCIKKLGFKCISINCSSKALALISLERP